MIYNKKQLTFTTEEELLNNNYCELTKKSPYACNSCSKFISNTCTKHYIVYEPENTSKLNKERKRSSKKIKCIETILSDIQVLLNKIQTIPHIEKSINSGVRMCTIFYCDKVSPTQKSRVENIHRLLRRVSPKGMSLEDVNQEEVLYIVNNINSLYKVKHKKDKMSCLLIDIL